MNGRCFFYKNAHTLVPIEATYRSAYRPTTRQKQKSDSTREIALVSYILLPWARIHYDLYQYSSSSQRKSSLVG